MGTCVSKCYPSPPSPTDCDSPHHHTHTTSPHTTTLETKPSKVHPSPTPTSFHHPTTSSFSSSSAPASSSTSSTFSSLSLPSSSSSSCATSDAAFRPGRSAQRPFSSEFLLACAMDSLDVVVLDPKKPVASNSSENSTAATRPPKLPMPAAASAHAGRSLALRGPPRRAATGQPFVSKRARSVSPTPRAGRKRVGGRTAPPAPDPAPPDRKAGGGLRSSAGEREAFLPRVYRVEAMGSRGAEGREVLLVKKKARGGGACEQEEPALVEDLNNPLISMDCFIFL